MYSHAGAPLHGDRNTYSAEPCILGTLVPKSPTAITLPRNATAKDGTVRAGRYGKGTCQEVIVKGARIGARRWLCDLTLVPDIEQGVTSVLVRRDCVNAFYVFSVFCISS